MSYLHRKTENEGKSSQTNINQFKAIFRVIFLFHFHPHNCYRFSLFVILRRYKKSFKGIFVCVQVNFHYNFILVLKATCVYMLQWTFIIILSFFTPLKDFW